MKRKSARIFGALYKNVFAALLLVMLIAVSAAGSAYAEGSMSSKVYGPLDPPPVKVPTKAPAKPVAPAPAPGYKWIDVDLSSQTLVAYQGNTAVFSTRISSGVAKHPTVLGTFYVYSKVKSQRMTGGVGREHYDLPNVPNIMYFYQGYAIHGTYWHNNFGHPMSHGCVNASQSAAAWLYNWTPMGTKVVVHP